MICAPATEVAKVLNAALEDLCAQANAPSMRHMVLAGTHLLLDESSRDATVSLLAQYYEGNSGEILVAAYNDVFLPKVPGKFKMLLLKACGTSTKRIAYVASGLPGNDISQNDYWEKVAISAQKDIKSKVDS